MLQTFATHESEVRGYIRSWPQMFDTARGSWLHSSEGDRYLDFFSGAGALNYGHNHPALKRALLDYIARDGLTHSLDMATVAKGDFIETFTSVVLDPRQLPYKLQFPGPTGTNAVESALKLARKVKGRPSIISFTNGFHGMTLGSLSVTGNAAKRKGAGVPLGNTVSIPFCNFMNEGSSLELLESLLADGGSGLDLPAAVIVETVQGEGGINVASFSWLRGLAEICRRFDILLIVDDIQMGCGRTGPFFSFEPVGIVPDIVCLSKSISGYGLPMALTLFKPELDVWEPGEHNGTFRGNNPAFVTAAEAVRVFWSDTDLERGTADRATFVSSRLVELAGSHIEMGISTRGRGLAQGLVFDDPAAAAYVCGKAFERGLILESAGPEGEVVKLMPPLTITIEELATGLDILDGIVDELAFRTGYLER